ncbi:tyrosine-type recombinase/integrase [Clostridium taeniosporum]|uniref:Transposase n=1 Tax=Clostridium taeniosporum TaxID=394958 RepID=A0A1D7XLR4_9CLOT|nr:tyrosine-type recombinase/integrase [Clostridium taeniosporum]AOR24288.2 transposase [Clostridium taeniosporum]AOR24319.2 transposase [Clostridium taeniosporum]
MNLNNLSNGISSYLYDLDEPWSADIWNLQDLLKEIYNPKKIKLSGSLNFTILKNENLKKEIKIFLSKRIRNRIVTAGSIEYKFKVYNNLFEFMSKYKKYKTCIDIDYLKIDIELNSYYIDKKISKSDIKSINSTLRQLKKYWLETYDTRSEYEKDLWDIRKINPKKVSLSQSKYHLNFTEVPEPYKNLAKKYMRVYIHKDSFGYCEKRLYSIRVFFTFIFESHNDWVDLKLLQRKDIENFIEWVHEWFKNRGTQRIDMQVWNVLIDAKNFVEYIQLAEYEEAPSKLVNRLFFKEDRPSKPIWNLNNEKYIPQNILHQLEENIEYLDSAYIPIVIILRATGLRISDVLGIRYNKCLELINDGWYVVMDISKTKIENHRIPITKEVAFILQEQIKIAEKLYEMKENPNKYIFVRESGVRAGLPPSARSLELALNKLARERNIVDDNGKVFHFKNHAFRHTKAVELINNGMNLLHVQKWLAHLSPEMTLKYAQLLDTTLRKSWEAVMQSGLFRINTDNGAIEKIDLNIENSDLIEWEYIRKNLDAVRIPLGYCLKPNKVQCNHQLNPCLTCSNMCTSPEFIHEFEIEINETLNQIERARQLGRLVWVEKNEIVLEKLKAILDVLNEGKVYHKAGKQRREFVGDERNVK